MAYLALIRHGESVLNSEGKECGWVDSPLTQKGIDQAKEAALKLPHVHWDYIFESDLTRSHQTTDEIIKFLGYNPVRIADPAIKERNYGIYTYHSKTETPHSVRRGWDIPIPQGESLKQVYARVVPYYQEEISPKLQAGKNVIVSAHGNSLRALRKFLDNISDDQIERLEMPTGEVKIYNI